MPKIIGRRELIGAFGGAAAVAWPLAARAQQAKLPTIGFLGAPNPSYWGRWVSAFVHRLGELGWTDGKAVAIEYRWVDSAHRHHR